MAKRPTPGSTKNHKSESRLRIQHEQDKDTRVSLSSLLYNGVGKWATAVEE